MNKLSLKRDTTSGIILIGISFLVWWQSTAFPQLDDGYPGPALFPQIIAFGLAFSGLYLAVKPAIHKTNKPKLSSSSVFSISGVFRLLAGLTLAILYPLLVQSIHFIPIMAMLILFVGLLLKNAAWHALFMSILSAALIYSLFTQLLNVPL